MAELILVRHGVTAWNKDRRFQGQIDIPLDDEGRDQAMRTGRRLAGERVDAVYSSDLSRARETADAIARAIGVERRSEHGLRERHYGAFEGRTHDEIRRDRPQAYARWHAREPGFALPGGGESLSQFHGRVLATLRTLASRHPGERVVAVTHGGVLDCAYRIASGLPVEAPRGHDLLNASLNRIAWDGSGFRLLAWADVAHLDRAADDVEARA